MERYFGVVISGIKSDFTFTNFKNFVIRKIILFNKFVALVTLKIVRDQEYVFVMSHRLILKVTKFHLLTLLCLRMVDKNILWGHHVPDMYVK